MTTRLKTLTTLAAICGTLVAAGPAQAKDNGNGTDRRCAAAVNGNHYGFSCEDVVDDAGDRCPRGYESISVTIYPLLDVNANNVLCTRR